MQQLQDRREKLFRSNNPGQIARQAVNSVGGADSSGQERCVFGQRASATSRARACFRDLNYIRA